MTELIFLDMPQLFIIPVLLAVISVICAAASKYTVLSFIGAVIHGAAIATVIYLGGGLTDVFFMLVISLIASAVSDMIKKSKGGCGK